MFITIWYLIFTSKVSVASSFPTNCHLLTLVVALTEAGGDPSGWKIPSWTVESDMEFCAASQIAFTFLSLTAPGGQIVQESEQASFCRQTNEYMASIRDSHPQSYGFFATIPTLLDLKTATEEIKYSLNVLKADGVTLFTRYGKGNNYLGHADFKPIWDLLDELKAVVFIHPTHPADTNLVNPQIPQPMIDYPHETTRTAVDLITSGTISTHPSLKIILSHAGGTLPYLAMRVAAMLPHIGFSGTKSTEEFMEDARSFYFDTALSGSKTTLEMLKSFAKEDHVLFGSDFPYAPTKAIEEMNRLGDEYGVSEIEMAKSINHGAGMKLFPKLKGFLIS